MKRGAVDAQKEEVFGGQVKGHKVIRLWKDSTGHESKGTASLMGRVQNRILLFGIGALHNITTTENNITVVVIT